MLVALRDLWQSGMNDIGTPQPDTISPIPEGIALPEAERLARQREPGDGSSQQSVVEQIIRACNNSGIPITMLTLDRDARKIGQGKSYWKLLPVMPV